MQRHPERQQGVHLSWILFCQLGICSALWILVSKHHLFIVVFPRCVSFACTMKSAILRRQDTQDLQMCSKVCVINQLLRYLRHCSSGRNAHV